MTTSELREKIRILIPQIYKSKQKADKAAIEYDELTKFPELKSILIDLLTSDFDNFLASIDWVAPRPTTFRINLKNDQNFYLIYNKRSWIAQVEGKKYYLLNLPEEQHAAEAISRILRYGAQSTEEEEEGGDDDLGGDIEDIGGSEETETDTEA
tara:strand:+ start:345 stop:806 length:462 start_codon:yes stop_codon:yes gene_type:complete